MVGQLELTVRAIALVALANAVVFAVVFVAQRSLIYFPGSTGPDSDLLPADAEAVELQTADGIRLTGWFLLARGRPDSSTADPAPGPALLICNGNAGDRSHRLPLAEALAERGYSVLLFDYRGYAGNPGTPSEDGLRADARAAVDVLAARPDVRPPVRSLSAGRADPRGSTGASQSTAKTSIGPPHRKTEVPVDLRRRRPSRRGPRAGRAGPYHRAR